MTLNEIFGWVTSLLQTLGLLVFISAFLVVALVLSLIDRLFRR